MYLFRSRQTPDMLFREDLPLALFHQSTVRLHEQQRQQRGFEDGQVWSPPCVALRLICHGRVVDIIAGVPVTVQ